MIIVPPLDAQRLVGDSVRYAPRPVQTLYPGWAAITTTTPASATSWRGWTADLSAVRQFIGVGIFQGLNTVLLLGFTFWRMFNLDANLALLTLIIVPLITISFFCPVARCNEAL